MPPPATVFVCLQSKKNKTSHHHHQKSTHASTQFKVKKKKKKKERQFKPALCSDGSQPILNDETQVNSCFFKFFFIFIKKLIFLYVLDRFDALI
jgi:hypothetical protein